MALVPEKSVNAPDTTIPIGSVQFTLTLIPDQGIAAVNVTVFDQKGASLRLPRQLPTATKDEQAAIVAATTAAAEAAVLPYLNRVLGIGKATHK